MKEIRFSEFFFKNHSISSKVTILHNLGHISLKKVGKIVEFPPFWCLVQKVGKIFKNNVYLSDFLTHFLTFNSI